MNTYEKSIFEKNDKVIDLCLKKMKEINQEIPVCSWRRFRIILKRSAYYSSISKRLIRENKILEKEDLK